MSDKQRPRRPKAIVTRRLPEAVETRMAELFDVELNLDDKPFDRARLEEAVARADVLVATLTDQVDADVIGKAGPQLKLIANFGNGVDHIDLKRSEEHTSELQSLMRNSYAVFCLKKKQTIRRK